MYTISEALNRIIPLFTATKMYRNKYYNFHAIPEKDYLFIFTTPHNNICNYVSRKNTYSARYLAPYLHFQSDQASVKDLNFLYSFPSYNSQAVFFRQNIFDKIIYLLFSRVEGIFQNVSITFII